MKKWQPGILSNARTGFGWALQDRGDYDTPEQSLGPVNHHRYWEACLTMTDKWLYSPKGPIKKAEGVLGMLIQVAGNGGNLLLNLGPNGKGEFVAEEVAEANRVGEWISTYGHTIKNTRRGIYIGGDYGASTQVGNTLYIHVLQKLASNSEAVISLPKLPMKILTASGVTNGFKKYEIKNGKLLLYFDKNLFNENLDNIVELKLSKNPADFERIETWKAIPVTKKELQIAESSFAKAKHKATVLYNTKGNVFSEGIHLKSWWEPSKEDKNPSISLSFTTSKKIKTILLSENMRSHSVTDFTIETKNANGVWEKVFNGNSIGEGFRIKLNGDAIYGVRLNILKSTYKTQITAFNVYE